MVDHDIIASDMMEYLQSELPPLFLDEGIDDFEDYLANEPPDNIGNRQLVVYMVDFDESTDNESVAITVHCQLPHILTPQKYETIIGKKIRKFDNSIVGATSKVIRGMVVPPGTAKDGGSSSFVFYTIQFDAPRDSCG